MPKLNRVNLKWLVVTAVVILIDAATKYLALTHLTFAQPVSVFPGLRWRLLFNTGAAFSFLDSAGGWQQVFFIGLAITVSVGLIIWLLRLKPQERLLGAALGLILGGALGNLFDRLYWGYVIDFIEVYYQQWSWPVFNIADSAICLGAFFMILLSFQK